MPGANFACAPALQTGSASCTLAISITVAPVADPRTPVALIPGLHPADLARAYALPTGNAGRTVAIVDAYDDPAAESDLAVYRAAFGLPPCTSTNGCFRKVDQRGGTTFPRPDPGWSSEIALDLDMVSAVCPRCTILLVEADSALIDDLGAGVDTAASLGATAVSNSYYALEWANEAGEDVHYRHPGIAITASSGDRGKPSYPAVSQLVTSVGGTSLTAAGEKPWTYSGSGCSAYVAKPAWQTGGNCSTRSAVDVAAVADPATGVAMFNTQAGGWVVAGGTSVGAPLIAAAYALGTPAAPAYSYAHPGGFHPLAPSGYDNTTGLGSPSGVTGL
jgi:subtilase family serine protease